MVEGTARDNKERAENEASRIRREKRAAERWGLLPITHTCFLFCKSMDDCCVIDNTVPPIESL